MGKPMFSCAWANFAHGMSSAAGYVLDDRGRIWFYDLGRTWSPEPVGELYAGRGLRARFAGARLMARHVEAKTLRNMLRKVPAARKAKVTRRSAARDAGGSGCTAYIWEQPDSYALVNLGGMGTYVSRNESDEANDLFDWLEFDLGMASGRPKGLPPRPRFSRRAQPLAE